MPTYNYLCEKGHTFEFSYDTMAEAKLILICPKCGRKADKQIALSNPVLGVQSGTYKGEKHQEEIKEAMKDFQEGKPKKEKP